ncbi:hypothetical protein ACC724_39565, partial [Rhizobium ruizarguesonis]
ARLAADPLGRENYEFARREGFILKEYRIFLKNVSAPHAKLVLPLSPSIFSSSARNSPARSRYLWRSPI